MMFDNYEKHDNFAALISFEKNKIKLYPRLEELTVDGKSLTSFLLDFCHNLAAFVISRHLVKIECENYFLPPAKK